MSGDIGIGKIIKEERHRDAIHIAVAPMEALVELVPGQEVSIHEGKAVSAFCEPPVGIVDPFLKNKVLPGQVFYVFLFPGSITSLRHEWVHPAFDKVPATVKPATPTPEKSESEKWLRQYAVKVNPYLADPTMKEYGYAGTEDAAYERLMDDLSSNRITYHGIDMHSRSELIDEDELRHHAQIILGRPINFDHFEYFSCTC